VAGVDFWLLALQWRSGRGGAQLQPMEVTIMDKLTAMLETLNAQLAELQEQLDENLRHQQELDDDDDELGELSEDWMYLKSDWINVKAKRDLLVSLQDSSNEATCTKTH
jgi:hypothetical protein